MNIEIERVSDDGLTRKVWRFYLFFEYSNGAVMRLNHFAEQSRKTTRHKFKSDRIWDSMDERRYHSSMSREDVPEPITVIAEAKRSVQITYRPLDKTGDA